MPRLWPYVHPKIGQTEVLHTYLCQYQPLAPVEPEANQVAVAGYTDPMTQPRVWETPEPS
jgi:hypothetical protein